MRVNGRPAARNESVPRPRGWSDFARGRSEFRRRRGWVLLDGRGQCLALDNPPGGGTPPFRVLGSQFVAAPQRYQSLLVAPLLPEDLAEVAVGLCEVRLEPNGLACRRGGIGPGALPDQ